jgi:hypothetical protein
MSSDPPRVEHDFAIPALSYDQAVNKQSYLRINMFFCKKDGISFEYFQRHWHHVHADLVTSSKAFKDNNIIRYNQFHQTTESRELARRLAHPNPEWSLEWDACSEFWVKKIEDWEAFMKSDEYVKATRKCLFCPLFYS